MRSPLEARRPVVFFANGIGDLFLTLPALRALHALFGRRLTLIATRHDRELCLSEFSPRRWIELPSLDGRRRFDAELLAARVDRCDLFISAVPWLSPDLLRLLRSLSPAFSIGFFRQYRRVVRYDGRKHAMEAAFDLVGALAPDLRLDDFTAPPVLDPAARRKALGLRRLLPQGSRVLAVHPDTARPKTWPVRSLRRALDLFLSRKPEFFAFVVGSRPQSVDAGKHAGRIIPTYGLELPAAASIVGAADLFLGVDSCMLHVADLHRVPGVGLFGPTFPHEFGFRLAAARHLTARRMRDIRPDAAAEALEALC